MTSTMTAADGTPKKKTTGPIHNARYKQSMCSHWEKNDGQCPYMEKCQFAHGEAELQRWAATRATKQISPSPHAAAVPVMPTMRHLDVQPQQQHTFGPQINFQPPSSQQSARLAQRNNTMDGQNHQTLASLSVQSPQAATYNSYSSYGNYGNQFSNSSTPRSLSPLPHSSLLTPQQQQQNAFNFLSSGGLTTTQQFPYVSLPSPPPPPPVLSSLPMPPPPPPILSHSSPNGGGMRSLDVSPMGNVVRAPPGLANSASPPGSSGSMRRGVSPNSAGDVQPIYYGGISSYTRPHQGMMNYGGGSANNSFMGNPGGMSRLTEYNIEPQPRRTTSLPQLFSRDYSTPFQYASPQNTILEQDPSHFSPGDYSAQQQQQQQQQHQSNNGDNSFLNSTSPFSLAHGYNNHRRGSAPPVAYSATSYPLGDLDMYADELVSDPGHNNNSSQLFSVPNQFSSSINEFI